MDGRESGRAEDLEGYTRYGGLLETYRAMFWEVYLWLQLGIEVGYFPRTECVDLMNHLTHREMFPSYASAFQKVGSLFPGALQILLLDGFQRNVYFTRTNYPPFADADRLSDAFNAALNLQVTIFSDEPITHLTAAITFTPTQAWETIFRRPTDSELIETQLAGGWRADGPIRLGVEILIAGLLRAIAYISNFRSCFESLEAGPNGAVRISDLILLERRCKEISFWRLNFHREDVRARFLQVARRLTLDVRKNRLPLAKTPFDFDMSIFERSVLELMGFWTKGVLMEISGSVGGNLP